MLESELLHTNCPQAGKVMLKSSLSNLALHLDRAAMFMDDAFG